MALTDEVIEQLAKLVTTTPEQFSRTFSRAQEARDERTDLAVAANAEPSSSAIIACLRFASKHGFAKQLLRCCIDDQVAGSLSTPDGRTFADLCRYHADIELAVEDGAMDAAVEALGRDATGLVHRQAIREGYRPEAVQETGFDCNVDQHGEQVQATRAMVCRIDDVRGNILGSGVLIAPHLVATAAHVVDSHVDATGAAKPDGAMRIKVRLNALTTAAGGESPVDLAQSWLAGYAPSDHRPRDDGGLTLPPPGELIDSHDVAILRLKEAPGWLRGWADVERAREPIDPERRGLCLHHHPGGAAQAISVGSHLGPHGCRFLHSCSTIRGSSGGPLLDHDARLVGLHHGCLEEEPGKPNVAGGGGWLAEWWASNPDERSPPPEVSPLWEIRANGPAGSGEPVIGFDAMQERVWSAQRREVPLAAIATMPTYAGRILALLIGQMLPSDLAQVVALSRADLDSLAREAASGATPVTTMLSAMAERFGAPPSPADPILSSVEVATDSVTAAQVANELGDRLLQTQTSRARWLIVNVGDGNLPSALSEALGHLYRSVIGLPRGRGKLVVIGSDPLIRAAVADLLTDLAQVTEWGFPHPDDASIERFILRWCHETGQTARVRDGAVEYLQVFKDFADRLVDTDFGGDWYAAICASLRWNVTERNYR